MGQVNLFTNKEEEKLYKNQSTWSKLVKTRDGWECVNKSKYPNRNHDLYEVNAHHIKPKKHQGENILSNGITYCRACHAAEHPEYQQKFFDVFKLQAINIKDKIFALFGIEDELKYYQLLYFLTGKASFRPLQKKIVKTIYKTDKHVFVVMPTGSGKSLLYQIPGLLKPQTPSLIISPLKALQLDQVKGLLRNWIPSTFINSDLSKEEASERIKGIFNHLFSFIFIHPKQLLNFDEKNQELKIKSHKPLTSIEIDNLVIDEVHVVNNQGISFVKEYYHLKNIYDLYNHPQMILLTATASKKTREFITDNLGIDKDDFVEFVSGFYRPEIELELFRTNIYDRETKKYIPKDEVLVELLKNKPIGRSIVFATTIDQVNRVHELLKDNELNVLKFHSKLDNEEKELNYKLFTGLITEDIPQIMVATSAFGMGIDIPDIHQVIHYSLPFSITDYYQQFGRAGRDGGKSLAQLLYDERESTDVIKYINSMTINDEKDPQLRELLIKKATEDEKDLLDYVNAIDKWQFILDYFGEKKIPLLDKLYPYLLFVLGIGLILLIGNLLK